MNYTFTLAPEEWRTISYYSSFLRTFPKKYWEWFLSVLFCYIGLNIYIHLCGYSRSVQMRYVICCIVFTFLWAFLIPYVGKWTYLFFLFKSGFQKNDTIVFHVLEDRLVISSETGSAVHCYFQFISKPTLKSCKEGPYKRIGMPVSDIYECNKGIYFWAPLQIAPVAFIADDKFDPETYAILRKRLQDCFGKHYHCAVSK